MAEEAKSLWFVTESATEEKLEIAPGGRGGDDIGGGFGAGVVQETRKIITRRVQIDADDLKREIGNLIAIVGDVFDQAVRESGLSLEEVELSIEVNSEGQISIFGSGGKIGGSGGIRLSFKRRPPAN
jgi:hypothetical protein